MKILVTGSSGFIGSHLTPALARDGHTIFGLDLREPSRDRSLTSFVRGDIRDPKSVSPALQGVDCLINLAAVHADTGHADEEYWETNEGGTRTLLDAMSAAGVGRHFFTSTVAVYGDSDEVADESTPPKPSLPYGASKLAAEHAIHEWATEQPDRCAFILRPCVVFGERNVANMYNLIRQIDSRLFFMFGSGKNVKAIAYVSNVVDAIRHGLDTMRPGVETFNYCDKPDLPVRQIVSIIHDELGRRVPPRLPLWLGLLTAAPFDLVSSVTGRQLPVSVARVRKLATATRFAARRIRDHGLRQACSSEEGLRRMVRYYRNPTEA